MARNILCLDWDRRALRVLGARLAGGKVSIEDAHSFRLPAGLDADDPQAMGGFIAGRLAEKGLRFRHAVVDLPREKAIINRLTLPPTPVGELPDAVRFQAMKELPFALEEAAIDFAVLGVDDAGRATEVLLVAVRREALDKLVGACRAAGLEPLRVGLRPCANMTAVHKLAGADPRTLFVDVQSGVTEISVLRRGALAFSRSAVVSVPVLDAHEGDSRVSASAMQQEVLANQEQQSAAVDELVVEITRSLQAYRVTESDPTIDRVLLAGSTGIESDLVSPLQRRLDRPVELFDAATPLGVSAEEGVKLRAFTAVLGLALGMADKPSVAEVDFLNPKRSVPRSASLQRRLRIAGLAAAVVVTALGGWTWRAFATLDRELVALRGEVDKRDGALTKRVRTVVEHENRAAEMDDLVNVAAASVWLDHLLNLTRAAVEPGKQMLASDAQFTGADGSMRISIEVASPEAASEFVEQLNGVRANGKPLYRASLGVWQDLARSDANFKGKVDVRVELLQLREKLDPAKRKALDRERKKRLDV